MSKVLIYLRKNDLGPTGGPLGYNYNLLQGIEAIKDSEIQIDFLSGYAASKKFNQFIEYVPSRILRNVINIVKSIYRNFLMIYGPLHCSKIDINCYDIIHFHQTKDMYCVRDSLKSYKGITILTSHSPMLLSREMYLLLSPFEKKHMNWLYNKLPIMDEFAFKRADYIIFPCKESEEPYYHQWPIYKNLRDEKSDKILYLLTGTRELQPNLPPERVRYQYKIPKDSFVISYVGRHDEAKGYDILKSIGYKFLEKHKNAHILVAGKDGTIPSPNHPRWIETGWSDNPASIIAASDVFLMANRETYFDLVAIEALSLGQLMVLPNNGGNKYFLNFPESGIFLYTSQEDAISKLEHITELQKEELIRLKKINHEIYLRNFTNAVFGENYLKIIDSILKSD